MGQGFEMRPLGKTGLQVSPLGIGAANGIDSQDVLYAFDQGINYFFYSSDLHHYHYQRAALALKKLCGHRSSVRDQVVLATVTYITDPEKLTAVLLDQFLELQVDYIDVFHWGWITDRTDMRSLLVHSQQLKRESAFNQALREMAQVATEVNAELVRRGLARFVGASFHSRTQARAVMNYLDVLMLRYNIAHLGAEVEVAPFLSGEKNRDPGVVVFNVAHEGPQYFHEPPPSYPAGQYVPTLAECYRFALTNSWVDVVLAGPSDRQQIDQLLAAREQGPLSTEECALIRNYGASYTASATAQTREMQASSPGP